jgi:hypothetical protein
MLAPPVEAGIDHETTEVIFPLEAAAIAVGESGAVDGVAKAEAEENPP